MQSFILKRSSTPTKGLSWLTSRVNCSRQQEWRWMSRSWKALALLEQFAFRLLTLRFDFCVGSTSNTAKQNSHVAFPMPRLPCSVWLEWAGSEPLPLHLHMVQLGSTPSLLMQQAKSLSVFTAAKVPMGLRWLIVFHEENRAGNVFFPLCLMYHNALHFPHEKRFYNRTLNTGTKSLLGHASVICLAKQILEIPMLFVNWP